MGKRLCLKYSSLEYLSLLFLVIFLVFSILSAAHAEVSLIWPVKGKVMTEYRDSGYEKGGHRGIDIESSVGDSVVAAADGKVIYVCYKEGSSSNLDHTVSISHEPDKEKNNLRTTYLQIKPCVAKNAKVKQGDVIGHIAPSMDVRNPAPHLHFGVKYGSDGYINPLSLLPALVVQSESEESSLTSMAPIGESATSNPTLNPAQVESVVPSQTEASLAASPNEESLGSTGTVLNHQEMPKTETFPQTESFSTSPSNAVVSANSPQLLPQASVAKSKENLKEPLLGPSRKFDEANLRTSSKNVHQGSPRLKRAEGHLYTETSTNPWQIALLSIAFFLTLFFLLPHASKTCFSQEQLALISCPLVFSLL